MTSVNVSTEILVQDHIEKPVKMEIMEAHDKSGHVGEADLQATLRHIGIKSTGDWKQCEGCAMAKARSKGVPKVSTSRATRSAERLCTDISGPYKSPS
mgnify:CR=1 FL=1